MKRIAKLALKNDEITQKCNPSQSASVDKPLNSDGPCGYLHAPPDGTYSRLGLCLRPEARGHLNWQGSLYGDVSIGRLDENG